MLPNQMRIGVRQQELYDCGPACMASVCRYHNLTISLERLRLLAKTTADGTTLAGMVNAFHQLGFTAKAVKADVEALATMEMPTIGHVILPNGSTHYVVFTRITQIAVEYMDPMHGRLKKRARVTLGSWWTGSVLVIEPTPAVRYTKQDPSYLQRMIALVSASPTAILSAALLRMVENLFMIVCVFEIKTVFERINQGQLPLSLDGPIFNLFSCVALLFLLRILIRFRAITASAQWTERSISRWHESVDNPTTTPEQPLDLIPLKDWEDISHFIHVVIPKTIAATATLILIASIMLDWSPKLTAVAFMLTPIHLFVARTAGLLARKQRKHIEDEKVAYRHQLRLKLEFARSHVGSKLMQSWAEKATRLATNLLEYKSSHAETRAYTRALLGSFVELSIVATLWMGTTYTQVSWITLSEAITFCLLVAPLYQGWRNIITFPRATMAALHTAIRLDSAHREKAPAEHPTTTVSMQPPQWDVAFNHVCFKYPGTRADAVHDNSFCLQPATITVLMGEPDAGKSTLIKLLMKRLVPREGRISIGGLDLNTIDARSVGEWIGYTSQDNDLLPTTLIENIVINDPDPNWGRLRKLCTTLGMQAQIDRLTLGYRTRVGEGGEYLTRMEIRKAMLARTFYNESSIILLDDPTHGLDRKTQLALNDLLCGERNKGKTIFVASNAASILSIADQVLVMVDGRITSSEIPRVCSHTR